jgi:hypothetical protein
VKNQLKGWLVRGMIPFKASELKQGIFGVESGLASYIIR